VELHAVGEPVKCWVDERRETAMSDGREEREEREKRREQEKKKDHEDQIDPEPADQWEPERVDS